MKVFLVSGGYCNLDFLRSSYNSDEYEYVIGVDGGAEYLYDAGIKPDLIIGDFDTVSEECLNYYSEKGIEINRYPKEKDETDTELAVMKAVSLNCEEIHLFAATGTRLDHLLGNIMSMRIAYDKNIKAYIIDEHNRIHIAYKHEEIFKSEQYGKYVSFIPMTSKVTGVTLNGFMYKLTDAVLTNDKGLAISNQIAADTASVQYKDGILLMIESKD